MRFKSVFAASIGFCAALLTVGGGSLGAVEGEWEVALSNHPGRTVRIYRFEEIVGINERLEAGLKEEIKKSAEKQEKALALLKDDLRKAISEAVEKQFRPELAERLGKALVADIAPEERRKLKEQIKAEVIAELRATYK